MERNQAVVHIRTNKTGLTFVYLGEIKLGRYYPERKVIEVMDHHKGGRTTEASVTELAEGLQRLAG